VRQPAAFSPPPVAAPPSQELYDRLAIIEARIAAPLHESRGERELAQAVARVAALEAEVQELRAALERQSHAAEQQFVAVHTARAAEAVLLRREIDELKLALHTTQRSLLRSPSPAPAPAEDPPRKSPPVQAPGGLGERQIAMQGLSNPRHALVSADVVLDDGAHTSRPLRDGTGDRSRHEAQLLQAHAASPGRPLPSLVASPPRADASSAASPPPMEQPAAAAAAAPSANSSVIATPAPKAARVPKASAPPPPPLPVPTGQVSFLPSY
jgi:hypothetical protein